MTFEGGTEGVRLDAQDPESDYFLTWTKDPESRLRGSSKALAVDVKFGAPRANLVWVRVPLCKSGGTADMRGKKFSVKMYVDGPQVVAPGKVWAGAIIPGQWGGVSKVGVPIKTEQVITGVFPCNEGAEHLSEVILAAAIDHHAAWQGTIYFDDVNFD
jgi:hypothetical protein